MGDYFTTGWLGSQREEWPFRDRLSSLEGRLPKVNMIDRDDEVFIKADMPGVDKKDIDVSMTDHTITIKGASKKQEKEEKGDYYRSEISRGAFNRSMALPAEVDI